MSAMCEMRQLFASNCQWSEGQAAESLVHMEIAGDLGPCCHSNSPISILTICERTLQSSEAVETWQAFQYCFAE